MVQTPLSDAFSESVLAVKQDMMGAKRPLARFNFNSETIEIIKGRDTVWIRISRPECGGLALRTNFSGGPYSVSKVDKTADGLSFSLDTQTGKWQVDIRILSDRVMRATVRLTPTIDLLIPYWPRDLYVLNAAGDPCGVEGRVEAAQRGYNTGLCYFCIHEPDFGQVLYLQNLSALNPFFKATATKPDGVVGGQWPELGYQPPASPNGNSPPDAPLCAGTEYVVSDIFLSLRDSCARDEKGSARKFLDMLSDIYPHLDRPEAAFHDWPDRARQTLHDLKTAPAASIEHYGHLYLHPYTASEYPDSMVQMSVISALGELETLTGKAEPFKDKLMAGMGRFFDKDLGTIRRYLPNVGKDKDADAVDSWYLYHPLMNLGRLALGGDAKARQLFMGSLDYAIRAAHHFKYIWPIQYKITDFSVVTETRGDGYGQTDVAGLYAYVMLLAHDLTSDALYLTEAKAAVKAAEGMRFDLIYQANLTAWGISACVRLWKIEEDERYLAQAEVFLASFVHNCEIWDSQIEHAVHYGNFFGVTCLHDAPYMAAYECFESFQAFDEVLCFAGEDLPPKMKLLMAEFRRFAFDRSWGYYPDALPDEAVAKDNIRNGYIDRNLSFPLEDLYGDGQVAGQVGQEIYGCGGAFIIAARGFYEREIPFRLFCDYPYTVTVNDASLQVALKGPANFTAQIRLLPKHGTELPDIKLSKAGMGAAVMPSDKATDLGVLYTLPADVTATISWPA